MKKYDKEKTMRGMNNSGTGGWLGRFWRDQRGSMSYFAVAGSMVMIVFGGIGVDLILAELKRNKIQNTLDRAVLAAASLENNMDPTFVVQEYFRAMDMADALQSVEVSGGQTAKRVAAQARETMPSNFMSLLGIDTLQAEGGATAANAVANLEISMVLDISGSMGGSKIEDLKTAAKSFVSDMVGSEDTTTTISIVPYNATVNLGESMEGYFALEDLHEFSYCGAFTTAEFASTSVTPDQFIEQLGHFDPVSTSQTEGETNYTWCHEGDTAAVLPLSSDVNALNTRIDSFTAWGNTAIDLGVKWGAALLDPAMRPAVDEMISDGFVGGVAAGRPAAFDATDTMKFLIVMTDGANTTQYDLPRDMKDGTRKTGVWLADMGSETMSDDKYSVLVQDNPGTDNDVYYWTRFASNANERYQTGIDFADDPQHAARELTFNELYDRWGTQGAADALYAQPESDGYDVWAMRNQIAYPHQVTVNWQQADSNLSTICSAAKAQGIQIYAIGVEAPSHGLAAMQDCASSPAHYFDIDMSELNATFASIGRVVTALRLTQ